ncbi:hypothetical protein GCM10010207_81480 [Streptomyces atratus]|nr:hypothetical protein GCM10010207_81480 [Streptomyces atratus]
MKKSGWSTKRNWLASEGIMALLLCGTDPNSGGGNCPAVWVDTDTAEEWASVQAEVRSILAAVTGPYCAPLTVRQPEAARCCQNCAAGFSGGEFWSWGLSCDCAPASWAGRRIRRTT